MSSIEVRPFRRSDREQLTELVNAHAAAVVPGLGVSVAAVLSQLERQPGEFIVDPWVCDRVTLVAEQEQRVTAAAHLLRYAADDRVGPDYRDAGEIHWLVFWPEPARAGSPPGGPRAADELMAASLRQLRAWAVRRQYAGGELPVRGVYGVPQQWPHVRSLYERSGFLPGGQIEIVFVALIDDLRPLGPGEPAGLPGLTARRSVGSNGTRLSAVTGDEIIGYIEAEVFTGGERHARHGNWADIGNLHVASQYRRRGVATWLLGQLAGWLHLAHVDRLLAYTYLEGEDETGQSYDADRAFLRALPFTELTQTARGWIRDPAKQGQMP
jgi:GNAT superfamily N-acetyltransferase